MVKLKRRLVLQLVVEQGRFWELVNEARQLRGIVPETRVPPANFFSQGLMPHQPDVYRIRDEVVAERYYRLFTFDWLGFIAACLMYQPPRLEMQEFADFGPGPFRYTFASSGRSAAESPRMVAPPIREIWGSDGRLRHEITVEEHTTEADVRQAYWRIKSARQEASKGGRPERDQFVAVQCAILHDEANPPDSVDGRRRRWSYERLAEEFDLESPRAAGAHVELDGPRPVRRGGGVAFGVKKVERGESLYLALEDNATTAR